MGELVFVHGAFGASSDWEQVADEFTNARCVDLPGHGQAWNRPALDLPAAARELTRACPRGSMLVGYSLGGRVALAAAIEAPGHFGGLVLESTTAGLEDEAARAERVEADARAAAQLRNDPAAFLRAFWERPLFSSLAAHPRREALMLERIQRAERAPGHLAESFEALSLGRQPDYWARLHALRLPTLVISGGLDDKFTAIARRLANGIEGARHVVVEGAGHNVHLEAPERFMGLLREIAGRADEEAA